jgi:hypothetical protein
MNLSMKFFCLPLLGLIALGGCASMSDEDCQQAAKAGWEPVGLRDGRNGEVPATRLASHREACEDAHVVPDQASYMRGWRRGLASYCTIQKSYDVGVEGGTFRDDLCQGQGVGDGAALLAANYRLGRQVHEIKEDIQRIENEISSLERKLDKNKDKDKNLSPEARRDIRFQIRRRSDELGPLRSMLYDAKSRPLVTR